MPKDGEFYIVGGKQGIHSHTMTQNIACLNAISREYHMERLWISAQDAEKLGVQTGDTVEVASSEHTGQVEARVTQRLKPGVVFLRNAYQHEEVRGLLRLPPGLPGEEPLGTHRGVHQVPRD